MRVRADHSDLLEHHVSIGRDRGERARICNDQAVDVSVSAHGSLKPPAHSAHWLEPDQAKHASCLDSSHSAHVRIAQRRGVRSTPRKGNGHNIWPAVAMKVQSTFFCNESTENVKDELALATRLPRLSG